MWTMIELIVDFVIDPLVDLFGVYKGNVGLWLMDTACFLGSLFFAIIATLFFTAGIWPAGLLFCLPAIALFLLHCRNYFRNISSVCDRRSTSVDVSADVKTTDSWEENRLRDKASEIRKGLDNN
ncbi:MAG: hypothetical protein IKC09_03420 [Oscillospiraceae bacterium]|nr:hypothetical protein [Oscillospiraceae bacterium]